MARVLSTDETTFYRALVTREDGIRYVYGPYSSTRQCIDRDRRYRRGPTTVEVQELRATASRSVEGIITTALEWTTIKTR